MLGRAFLPEEDQTADSHPVAVISYNCWQHRFGGDPHIVGKIVEFNSRSFTVVGVAPKGFIGTEVAYDPEMFIPVMMAKTIEPGSTWIDKRDSNNLFTVGRLKPSVWVAQAKAELKTLTAQLAKDYPVNVGRGICLGKPGLFIPDIANSVFAFTGVLAAVGALVILLACVNLASQLRAAALDRDGNSFQPHSCAAIVETATRPRVESRILDGRFPSLTFAELSRCGASQPFVDPAHQRRSYCAQSAIRSADAARLQS